ncbi:hypothetical protein R84B8_01848 [Treponema sp. R8-4-B8]
MAWFTKFKEGFSLVLGIIGCIAMVVFGIAWLIAPKTKVLEPYNPSIASENAAIFVFHNNFNVKKINDHTISWRSGLSRSASIELPTGEYTFLVDFSDNDWKADNIIVTGYFEQGKIYLLTYFLDTKEKKIRHLIKEVDKETFEKIKKSMWQGKYFKNKELK